MNPGRQRGREIAEIQAVSGEISVDWEDFRNWLLKDHRPHTVASMFSYAKQYAYCLFQRDLSDLRDVRDSLRPNIIRGLSALSKYVGMHDEFKELLKRYGLKWTGRSSDDLLIERIIKVKNPDEVFNWVKEVKQKRPDLTEFMHFIAITGLRLEEAVESFNLIIKLFRENRLNEYYNEANECLEHFRFKETFIRKSKKVFVSFVPKALIDHIKQSRPLTSKHAVQKYVRVHGLKLRFADVREAHASFLTKYLRPPEIDFLQGRVSSSVFMQNYFNPALIGDLKDRTFKAIAEIEAKIS